LKHQIFLNNLKQVRDSLTLKKDAILAFIENEEKKWNNQRSQTGFKR